MQNKRGQLTLFIIIGIILIVVIFAYQLFYGGIRNNEIPFEKRNFGEQSLILKSFIKDCLKIKGQETIIKIGSQGGYYEEPLDTYLLIGGDILSVYYIDSLTYIPSKSNLEEEISAGLEYEGMECLINLDEFGLEIDYNLNSVKALISEKEIELLIDLNLEISNKEETISLDFKEEKVFIDSSLLNMNSLASYITISHQLDDEVLDISSFISLAKEYDLLIDIINDPENSLFVNIIDNKTDYYPKNYRFVLLNKEPHSSLNSLPDSDLRNYEELLDEKLNIIVPEI
jgi:hypothetical protein